MRGLIVKTTGPIYGVESDGCFFGCRARGRLRLGETEPLAGDIVEFTAENGATGVITEVLPRKNSLIRPPVANIDKLIIIASAAPPVTDLALIDQLTALSEYKGITPVICVNKADLEPGGELTALYSSLGYKTVLTSAVTGLGLNELAEELSGYICVLTGNSGVGKSSILNTLNRSLNARTGDLSEKIGRGKQTTRHIELFPAGKNGYTADTPGYSAFDSVQMEMTEPDRIPLCFPEFLAYLGKCRYGDCGHVKDEGCEIRAALGRGEIAASRFESYVKLREAALGAKKY